MLFSQCFRRPLFGDSYYRYAPLNRSVRNWAVFKNYCADTNSAFGDTEFMYVIDFEATDNFMSFETEGAWYCMMSKRSGLYKIRFNDRRDYAMFRLMGFGEPA